MENGKSFAGPVGQADRIVALDVLRGFAILGILLINVESFSMISAAYMNPSATDAWGGIDTVTWAIVYMLADQKFMTLFAILFGAGIALMAGRAEARGSSPLRLHYTRTFWLLLIGFAHGHLLWHGDILFVYAVCAFVVIWARRLRPRILIALAIPVLCVAPLISTAAQLSMPFWPPEDVAELAAEWAPPADVRAAEIDAYRGGWRQQQVHRGPAAWAFETFILAVWGFWRASGLMLLGMALYKLGVVTAERSDAFYWRLAGVTLPLGFLIVGYGVYRNLDAGFAFETSMFLGTLFNYFGSVPVSLGYLALVMLACRRGWLAGLQARLAAAGRMALTNYLTQTILCTFIFYGHGLGMFERLHRPAQLGIVIAVWVLQLAWSPWWLARFRFGPFEWLWRSLTYLRLQPLRV